MNWKIIFQLSSFGFIMAIATIFLIPITLEPVFWIIIFAFCSFVIAKVCTGKYFLHGVFVCLINCFWIITFHVLFAKTYTHHHLQIVGSIPHPLGQHPRLAMVVTGPIFGIISGLVLGSFSWVASKIIPKTK